jgi:hypothetical protein
LASMPKPIFPHQVDIREMWLCQVLDLNRLGQWIRPILWIVEGITL